VFLSGGIDSGGLVAAMARAGAKTRTFSLGFPPAYHDFDERRHARLVADRFHTDHEEVVVEPNILETIHTLARVFDEPMGDAGAVPNYLVCQSARRGLTVALSGLGGDELSGGYQRHLGVQLAEQYRKLPAVVRHGVVRRLVEALPESATGARTIDQAKRFVHHADLPWLERFFAFSSPLERQRRAALYTPALRARVDFDSALGLMRGLAAAQPDLDLVNRVLSLDLHTYMIDDLLTVADRTSMAVSLELRVPFLDHPLVEFMAGVPGAMKIRGLQKKHFLRTAFRADLPPEILAGRKRGFSLPVARWLREELRGVLEDVLSPARLARDGMFEPRVVDALKREHLARRRDWSGVLWALLMFHLWADHYRR